MFYFIRQTLSSINSLLDRADSVYKLLVKHRNELDQLLTSLAGGFTTSRSVWKERWGRGREREREGEGGGEREREDPPLSHTLFLGWGCGPQGGNSKFY